MGEWYEQPRVVTNILKCSGNFNRTRIPKKFTVRTEANPKGGEGHMLFFYDKLGWLRQRYESLISEMQRRGYNPSDNWNKDIFQEKYSHLFNDWVPTLEDITLSRSRIAEMVPDKHDLSYDQFCDMAPFKEYVSTPWFQKALRKL